MALTILLALGTAGARGQGDVDLASLTVPPGRLTPGCALSPGPTVSLGGNRVRSGLWTGLPANPWIGSKPAILADIRERVAASPPAPDGPPLSATEMARFRAQLTDDVEEAYGAVYSYDATHLIVVNAVRFKVAPVPDAPRGMSPSRGYVRLVRGRTVISVFGEGGRCVDAIAAYLTEIAAR